MPKVHNCIEFDDVTYLDSKHQTLKCVECRTLYYNVVDEHPELYYKNADGSIRKGSYKSHLVKIANGGV